jgi:hypothetical protein
LVTWNNYDEEVGSENQTDGMDNDRTQEPHRDVQDKENDESSNSICHEDFHPIWLEDGTLLMFHWALKLSS